MVTRRDSSSSERAQRAAVTFAAFPGASEGPGLANGERLRIGASAPLVVTTGHVFLLRLVLMDSGSGLAMCRGEAFLVRGNGTDKTVLGDVGSSEANACLRRWSTCWDFNRLRRRRRIRIDVRGKAGHKAARNSTWAMRRDPYPRALWSLPRVGTGTGPGSRDGRPRATVATRHMTWRTEIAALEPGALLLAAYLVAMSHQVSAQELEPRSYSNTPIGMNFLIAGYAYTSGNVATDPSLPLANAELEVDNPLIAYAHALDVWGKSGKVDVVVPYAWLSGSVEMNGQPITRDVSGFGDPRLRFSVNFYGAPALSLEEFAAYKQDLIVGASVQVSAPLGQYDDDKLVNIGTNRWSVKPELGLSKAFGPLTLELAAGVTFYTDNDDFFGGQTREQDPLYSVQGHVIYGFSSGIWIALDGTWYTGGQTTVDGIENDDRLDSSRVGMTVAFPVNRYNSIKLYGSTGVSARVGGSFDTVGVAWQVRWGAGL